MPSLLTGELGPACWHGHGLKHPLLCFVGRQNTHHHTAFLPLLQRLQTRGRAVVFVKGFCKRKKAQGICSTFSQSVPPHCLKAVRYQGVLWAKDSRIERNITLKKQVLKRTHFYTHNKKGKLKSTFHFSWKSGCHQVEADKAGLK